jgi:hypothetical protein
MDRSRRVIKKPLTYWEEYVVTDEWYTAALVEDVPASEMHAALEDEDFSVDVQEERDGEEDCSDNILSEECESSEYVTDDCSDSDSTQGSEGSEGSKEVLWSGEGESGSEGSDECSTPGSVY